MIRKLRTKLVAAAMLSLLAVLTVILGVILLTNYRGIVSDADRILDLLADNQGKFPEIKADFDWEELGPRHRSVELGYETRYFSVLLDRQGTVLATDTGKIAAVDEETAASYAQAVWAQDSPRGFWQDYRYLEAREGENTRVIFLDYGAHLFTFHSTLVTSLWVAASGLLAVLLLLLLLSRRIIKPVIEGHEKQKRFITDAGHEIKTPITAARLMARRSGADTRRKLEAELDQIGAHVERALFYARAENPEKDVLIHPANLSDLVNQAVQAHRALLLQNGVSVELCDLDFVVYTDRKWVCFLLGQLLQNAARYRRARPVIALSARRQEKRVELTVSDNGMGIPAHELPRVFDRGFTGSNGRLRGGSTGMGLYLAKKLADALEISLAIRSEEGVGTQVLLTFPAQEKLTKL